jgi:hypothetical protein
VTVQVVHNDPSFNPPKFDADGDQRCPSMHAGLNDGHAISADPDALVGTDDAGNLTEVSVVDPLEYDVAAKELRLKQSYQDAATAETAARAAADAAETDARVAAVAALAATVVTQGVSLARIPSPLANYLNDAAAAAGGVPVGGFYRNGSVVMVRVA